MRIVEQIQRWWYARRLSIRYGVPRSVAAMAIEDCNGEERFAELRLFMCKLNNHDYRAVRHETWRWI